MAGPVTVPPGVRPALSLGLAARVLDLSERRVRSWVDAEVLLALQPGGSGRWRYVRAVDLAEFANRNGLSLHWEVALE